MEEGNIQFVNGGRQYQISKRKSMTKLHGKKRGRPLTYLEEVTTCVIKYIRTVREAGGVVNTAIIVGVALGIVRHIKPAILECNGGHLALPENKDWAKYLLAQVTFVK